MKHVSLVSLVIALGSAAAGAQTLPDNPSPTTPGTAGWSRLGNLARGEEITVAQTGQYSLHCRYAGATDDYLFCDEAVPWTSNSSYRIERAEIENVRMDQSRTVARMIVCGGAIAGGLWFGISSSKSDNTQISVASGLLGAGVGALITFIPAETVKVFHLIPGRLVYREALPNRKSIPVQPDSGQLPSRSGTAKSAD